MFDLRIARMFVNRETVVGRITKETLDALDALIAEGQAVVAIENAKHLRSAA
jgi:GTP cyclohydrolase I